MVFVEEKRLLMDKHGCLAGKIKRHAVEPEMFLNLDKDYDEDAWRYVYRQGFTSRGDW